VLAVFYLNNKQAERELKVNYNNEILPFCPADTLNHFTRSFFFRLSEFFYPLLGRAGFQGMC